MLWAGHWDHRIIQSERGGCIRAKIARINLASIRQKCSDADDQKRWNIGFDKLAKLKFCKKIKASEILKALSHNLLFSVLNCDIDFYPLPFQVNLHSCLLWLCPRLVVEARLPKIKNVMALQTMMRVLGKDAPLGLKRKLEVGLWVLVLTIFGIHIPRCPHVSVVAYFAWYSHSCCDIVLFLNCASSRERLYQWQTSSASPTPSTWSPLWPQWASTPNPCWMSAVRRLKVKPFPQDKTVKYFL